MHGLAREWEIFPDLLLKMGDFAHVLGQRPARAAAGAVGAPGAPVWKVPVSGTPIGPTGM